MTLRFLTRAAAKRSRMIRFPVHIQRNGASDEAKECRGRRRHGCVGELLESAGGCRRMRVENFDKLLTLLDVTSSR